MGQETLTAKLARWSGFDSRGANALDVGRGIAILAVLYGHALAPWFMDAGARFNESAFLQWKFGASFMMCFFFFLSGASWRENRSLDTTFRQALTLLLLTWFASIAFDVVQFVITIAGWAPVLGIEPVDAMRLVRNAARMAVFGDSYSMSALWFLAALAIVRVIAAIMVRVGTMATMATAAVLLVLSLTATELYWRNFHQVTLIGVAFISFLAGHASIDGVRRLEQSPRLAWAFMLGAGALTALTFDLNQGCRWDMNAVCGEGWLNDRFGVSMILGQFGNLAAFTFTSITGVAFAMALSIVLAQSAAGARLSAWGRNSLHLLIVNCVFLELANPAVARWIMPQIGADAPGFFLGLFVITLVLNLAAAALMKRPLRELQSFSSSWASRIINAARRAVSVVGARASRVSPGA